MTVEGFAYLDFEGGRGRRSDGIEESARRELLYFAQSAADTMGRENLTAFVAVLISSYSLVGILNAVADAEFRRRLYWVHQWRDTRKRRRQPQLVDQTRHCPRDKIKPW